MLTGVYLGIVALAESPAHALDLFWEGQALVIPILLGFGVQAVSPRRAAGPRGPNGVGLFTYLKQSLPAASHAAGSTTAAGGSLSTAAMVACAAHHAADVLPLLGLTAAAAFLANWKVPFMVAGLLTNLIGIAVMIREIHRARRHLTAPLRSRGDRMTLPHRLAGLVAGLLAAPVLTACAALAAPTVPALPTSLQPTTVPAPTVPEPTDDLTRTDVQGSVEFAVTPLNLKTPSASLDFMVVMNTHSGDLAWDLAAQATLTTDTGLEVKGLHWPASSGHHVEGTLSFPSQTADGQALLAGAKSLTLTILDTDVPERVFVWSVGQ